MSHPDQLLIGHECGSRQPVYLDLHQNCGAALVLVQGELTAAIQYATARLMPALGPKSVLVALSSDVLKGDASRTAEYVGLMTSCYPEHPVVLVTDLDVRADDVGNFSVSLYPRVTLRFEDGLITLTQQRRVSVVVPVR